MLNINNFYSNIDGTISVDDTIVANISANLSTSGNINITKMIIDKDKYFANITTILADVKAFEEKVFADFNNTLITTNKK